jgi:hypothetical protein
MLVIFYLIALANKENTLKTFGIILENIDYRTSLGTKSNSEKKRIISNKMLLFKVYKT